MMMDLKLQWSEAELNGSAKVLPHRTLISTRSKSHSSSVSFVFCNFVLQCECFNLPFPARCMILFASSTQQVSFLFQPVI